ncbi:MAG: radical SAM family heme chaperone HemW [bacterium]|nr:radical SAM family heme chaperone HemW [bacterium]
MNDISSVYIHIPFCIKICTYCDFCKMYYDYFDAKEYLLALKEEINKNYKGDLIKTLYIGGGTPSCLNEEELTLLFDIIKIFNLSSDLEFTFECNVSSIDDDFLSLLKEGGVNRLSIGVQSFNEKILNILGREKTSFDKLELAKKYFDNINIDLIYGVNGESISDLKEDLEKFLSLDVSHISIYSLILEDNTILKVNNYEEISDDLNRDMYDLIVSTLKRHGYVHYEISNFAKEGYKSLHNLCYWNNDKYYGFGLGASGYISNIRYTNTRNIKKYLRGDYLCYKEVISKKVDMENFMILGLRKTEGVSNYEFKKRYGLSIKDVFDTKKLDFSNDMWYISEQNLFISNLVLQDFIDI